MVVDVGTEYLSESDNIQRYSVTRIFCHPDVALLPLEKRYDVALIELEEPIAFSSSVSSVGLGTINDELEVPVVAVGWGYVSDFNKFIPDKVRVSELTTDKYEDCQEKHAKEDNIVNKELNICASGSEGNTVCQGMSGGPLVDRRTGLQVGVSSGMKDCTAEFPFLFARIESVIDWINDVTGLGLVLN
jgi:secreted trypsin-like serine protease